MSNIIEFKNINKSYGSLKLLKDFNLKIEKGSFLCIVGSSGSGKTTIMKMINALIKADSGEILINNQNIDDLNLIKLRRKIGYVIQGNGLFPHLTVKENIAYVLRLEKYPEKEIEKIVDDMLNLVGLGLEVKEKYPNQLSGGQQQRVGIARAYSNKPEILLMDEPFGAVDSITRYQLQNDLKKIHSRTNCTVVFITHDIKEAQKLASDILVLDNGEIQQYDKTNKVFENPSNDFVRQLIEMAN